MGWVGAGDGCPRVAGVSLALYRRHRPETFEEVVGQEHVTTPLQQALRNDRVNHAYLFSGPRGCGKTTSARILARCLNCEEGPTPTPCGTCRSCLDLTRGGTGSIDVIEIDAASHGGVDDAREIRESAHFAPAHSRFKIFIVDEAHMVTQAGFNALLKLVEEPPAHVKFIFATTEPEKVIGTIRSRTHHYPFRLVPPGVVREYIAGLCELEKVEVEPAVLPLVVRAGTGSMRDTLSVLDQLIAGSGPEGVTYALATSLLGCTDEQLIDAMVDGLAAQDGPAVFGVVDQVVEAGHDPRRFVADLLERLRDLVILAAVPGAADTGLLDRPVDQLERMSAQAGRFGAAELSRAADLVNTALTEMRGATAPRLQLELLCARLMLPAVDGSVQSLLARLERLERGVTNPVPASGSVASARSVPAEVPVSGPAVTDRPAAPAVPAAVPTAASVAAPEPPPAATPPAPDRPVPATAPTQPAPPAPAPPPSPVASGGMDANRVRHSWSQILDAVKNRRRFSWILLSQNGQVVGVDDGRLQIAFVNAGARDSFTSSSSDDVLAEALGEVLGGTWRVEALVDPSGQPAEPARAAPVRTMPAPPPAMAPAAPERPAAPPPVAAPASGEAVAPAAPAPVPTPPEPEQPVAPATPARSSAAAAARKEASRAAAGEKKTAEQSTPVPTGPSDDEASADDADLGDTLRGHELLIRELGATVIEERENG